MRYLLTIALVSACLGQVTVKGKITLNSPGPVTITITPADTKAVVTPQGKTIAATQTQAYQASGNNTGSPLCVSSGWTSSNTGVATIVASTGIATGVAAGSTTITCTDPGGLTGNATLTIETGVIFTTPSTPCSGACILQSGVQNSAYSYAMAASGGTPPYNFSVTVGSLPTGLSLASTNCGPATNCLITGTPTGTGTTNFTVQVCDSISSCTSQAMSITVNSANQIAPKSPTTWVNSHEMDAIAPDITVNFPSSGSGGNWTCVSTNYGPYTASSSVSLNQVLSDMEACRTANNKAVTLVVPAGMLFTGTTQIIIPQSASSVATKPLVVMSSGDAGIPYGTGTVNTSGTAVTSASGTAFNSSWAGFPILINGTYYQIASVTNGTSLTLASSAGTQTGVNFEVEVIPCVGGIQDNLSGAVDVFINSPTCNGTGMFYYLAGTQTTVSGAFTLANGTATNTSQYNHIGSMFTIENSGTNLDPLKACSPVASGGQPPQCTGTTIGPDHWIFEDIEVRLSAGNTGSVNLIGISRSGNETSTTTMSSHIHFRKMWLHGDWGGTLASLTNGRNKIADNIVLDCVYCSLEDSWMNQSLSPGTESHCVLTQIGSIVKIVHDACEGGSIGFFSGGFATTTTFPLNLADTDIQRGRNRWSWPVGWLGVNHVPAGNTVWGGQGMARKNCSESKVLTRSVFYGEILENVDNSGAQNGICGPQFNIRNVAGGFGSNYAAVIQDNLVYGDIFRTSCNGFTLAPRSSTVSGSGGGVSLGMQRSWIINNLWYNVSNANQCTNVSLKAAWEADQSPANWQVTMSRDGTGTVATATLVCTNQSSGNCPAGPPPTGWAQSTIRVGEPVSVYGCTGDTTFNTGANAIFTSPSTAKGGLAQSGTLTTGLTVVYPSTGPANSTDNTLNCTLAAIQGYPLDFLFTHNTAIGDTANFSWNTGTVSHGARFSVNNLIRDNISMSLGIISGTTEGFRSQNLMWDVSTLTTDHNVYAAGRTASNYFEYGNNPFFSDSAGCTGSGCNPPKTESFPATAYCTGATSDSTCIGFVGAMSASSMPIFLADWTQYALRSDSQYHNTASDGTDRGANMTTIQNLEVQNPFICPSFITCTGSPFQD